jgi:4-hydroxy-tetrahydrodipicolinate synthase
LTAGRVLEGIVPILVTPFDRRGAIDEESLGQLIEFNIAAGVHGLGIALASEVLRLNERERHYLITCTAGLIAGRVPLVVNTGAPGTDLAIHYARSAIEAGASAVMVAPPFFPPLSRSQIIDYFRDVAAAVDAPIVLQDTPQAPIPAPVAAQLARDSDNVRYIKVERPPLISTVSEMCAATRGILTVFGGGGGGFFLEEFERGARGTMPFPSQPRAFVHVWDRLHAGALDEAQAAFRLRIAMVERLTSQLDGSLAVCVHKQLLVRQGVIRSAGVRGPVAPIDAPTQRDIDAVIDTVLTRDN